MSENDKESQSEQPTEKRLSDAVERGETPVAREPSHAASLIALGLLIFAYGANGSNRLAATFAILIERSGLERIQDAADVQVLIANLCLELAVIVGPVFGVLLLAGLMVAAAQMKVPFVLARVKPQASRISPMAGLKRLFGRPNLQEFAKSVAKLALLGWFSTYALHGLLAATMDLGSHDVQVIPEALSSSLMSVLLPVAFLMAALAGLDVAISRAMWTRNLRMSKAEVRSEAKEQDGDPLIEGRRRALARARSKQRVAAAVPRATVVIANPTHYSVALRFVRSEGGAPVVVARGVDFNAIAIRRLAEQLKIPVVENRALARALYGAVKVDQRLPQEFYRAVADVLVALQKRGLLNFNG